MLYEVITEALLISDGFAPFMRCNYLYAHRSLSPYAKSCITGMYGSEFIKPMHVMADSVSINSRTVQARITSYNVCYTKLLRIGFNASMNLAVEQARGELFLIAHADDEITPDALEKFALAWYGLSHDQRQRP